MKRLKVLLISFMMSICFSCPIFGLYINELMPSNIDCLIDDLFDYPDSWVEIYNSSDEDINIKNWYLSNKKSNLTLWRIPVDCKIPAKGYKVIYMDEVNSKLHANFRLDIGGDRLYLTKPDGVSIVDISEKYTANIPANNVWGRLSDGSDNWGWLDKATPESSNNNRHFNTEVAPKVLFNVTSGLYEELPEVILSLNEDNLELIDNIYYSIDGSEPTLNSLRFTSSIILDSTTVIRARVITNDLILRRSDAISIIHKQREHTLPVVSLIMEPDHLWDDSIGIYVDGVNGKLFGKTGTYHNWNQDWRRPMHIDYIDKANEVTLNQDGELCIMGGWSREYPMKSLKIYSNKRFGENRFKYNFFQDKEPLDKGYKSFILRNSGQDFNNLFCRDAVNQYFMGQNADLDFQAYQPVIVYINGIYWGIQNIRERSNHHYVNSNYDLDEDEIDMFENQTLKCGTINHFNEMYSYICNSDIIDFSVIDSFIDIDEFINYIIIETFVANGDWIKNNVVFWRNRDQGKWRWLIKDTDYSHLGYSNKAIEKLLTTENAYLSNIFKKCMSNDTFKNKFVDRNQAFLGDFLDSQSTRSLFDKFIDNISEEMKFHRPRWNMTYDSWFETHDNSKYFIRRRADSTYFQIHRLFDLGYPVKTDISIKSDYDLIKDNKQPKVFSINNVTILKDHFNGRLFSDRVVNLKIENDELVVPFEYWEVTTKSKKGDVNIRKYFDKDINIVFEDSLEHINIYAVYEDIKPYIEYEDGSLIIKNRIHSEYLDFIKSEIQEYQGFITNIDLSDVKISDNIDLDQLFEDVNPNRIIILNEDYARTCNNSIVKGHSEFLSLNTNYEFKNTSDFTADSLVIVIERYENQNINETAFYPLVLPFDYISTKVSDNNIFHYKNEVFVSADRWFANEPFILEDKNENGDIYLKLEFKDVRIEKTSDSLVHANVDGTLIGGYKWFEGVKDFLVINKAPFDKHAVGNVFVNETDAIIRPFESFISSEEIKEIITTNINKITPESAISITQFNNVLIIYNSQLQPVKMNIYTIDGRIYKMIDVKSGENRIVIDVPGIYFIDNKKKLIK